MCKWSYESSSGVKAETLELLQTSNRIDENSRNYRSSVSMNNGCQGESCSWKLRELTWGGNAVSVSGHVIIQREQQDPHGQGEQASQETVEHQVEEQDERWKNREEG